MILTVFIVFLVLAIVLIVLGLSKPEESYMAIVGFLLLFLLSLIIINYDLEYKTGETREITYNYYFNSTQINYTAEVINYNYTAFNVTEGENGFVTTHLIGYWLAVMSFVGFILVIIGLKGGFRRGE